MKRSSAIGAVFTLSLLAVAVMWAESVSPLGWNDFFASWGYWHETLCLGVIAGGVLSLCGFWMIAKRNVFASLAISSASVWSLMLAALIGPAIDTWGADLLGITITIGVYAALWRLLKPGMQNESVLGVIYLASLGGVILVSNLIAQGHHEFENRLFGNSMSVNGREFAFLTPVFLALGVTAAAYGKKWRSLVFDGDFFAANSGVTGRSARIALTVFCYASLIAGARSFGILVAFALFLFPPLIAWHQSASNRTVVLLSALYGVVVFPAGFLVSFFLDWPTGACISGTACGVLLLTQAARLVLRRAA